MFLFHCLFGPVIFSYSFINNHNMCFAFLIAAFINISLARKSIIRKRRTKGWKTCKNICYLKFCNFNFNLPQEYSTLKFNKSGRIARILYSLLMSSSKSKLHWATSSASAWKNQFNFQKTRVMKHKRIYPKRTFYVFTMKIFDYVGGIRSYRFFIMSSLLLCG